VPLAISHRAFRIKALTLGYSRDLLTTQSVIGALGANVTFYSVAEAIRPYYGRSPHAAYVFVRVRGGNAGAHGTHSM
jgi:hypothetical protein